MDELLIEAIESILSTGMASKAFLQRKFKIGYQRASQLIDVIETMGIIGSEDANQQRCINITLNEWLSIVEKRHNSETYGNKNRPEKTLNEVLEDRLEQSTFSIDEVWKKVSEQLRTELSENSYNKWFLDVVVQHSGDKIILITPNDFHKEIIESRYTSLITYLFHLFTDSDLTVNIVATKNTI